MKRLQRKFMLLSALAHGTLLLVLLVGPGFVRRQSRPPEDLPVLRVIPSHLIDAQFFQVATPSPESAPAEPPGQPAPTPAPAPRETPPPARPVEPVVNRTPPVTPPARSEPAVRPPPRETPPAKNPPPAPEKKAVSVSKSLVTRGSEVPPKKREETGRTRQPTQESVARAVANQVQSALSGIRESLSDTVVSVPGVGGAAYANYRQVVQSLYDQAWIEPQDVSRPDLAVLVEVVIRRDGKVLSDSLLKSSGNQALDRSVQAALDRVRVRGLPPFPEEANDLQRTFRIEFNLRTRRLSG